MTRIPIPRRPWRWHAGLRVAAGLLPLALAGLTGVASLDGCSSDDPNSVGGGLGGVEFDTLLVPLTIRQVDHYGVLDVTDSAHPLDQAETLYLGSDGDDASSILVTFDFSAYPDNLWTAEYLRASNINRVDLTLNMLTWYFPNHGNAISDSIPNPRPWTGAQKYYDVHQLLAPFDTLSHPGPEPAFEAATLDVAGELEPASGPIFVQLSTSRVATWLANGEKVSIIIREGSGSQPGLLGFASKEMVHGGSTLPMERPSQVLGPALIIEVNEAPASLPSDSTNLVIGPVADVSTWHSVGTPPATAADGIEFRTPVRSYPALSFDLAALPNNVHVNRADIFLTTDTTRTVGPSHAIVVSEIPPDFAPAGVTHVTLGDLGSQVYQISGRTGLDPADSNSDVVNFNVTTSIQRYLNGVYSGERAFLLAGSESLFPSFATSYKPDFWYVRRVFHGTAADSAQQPRLRVIYSRDNDVTEVSR